MSKVSHGKNDAVALQLIKSGRLVVDFENGLVYSQTSNTPTKPVGSKTKRGYMRATISVGGKQVAFLLHRIVWIAANGIPDEKTPQINHKDTNKTNNKLSNLELQDNVGNCQHAAAHGLMGYWCRGVRAAKGKLTGAEVIEIRRLHDAGRSAKSIAKQFKVSANSIECIINKKSWAWFQG